MVLLLSVRESSLPCPPKVWGRITEASLLNAEHTLWLLAETSLPPFFFSWGLRQVWRPLFSPLHSTGSYSLKLACYNLLRRWGAAAHHFRINGCRWKLGFSAFRLQEQAVNRFYYNYFNCKNSEGNLKEMRSLLIKITQLYTTKGSGVFWRHFSQSLE